MHSDRRPTVHRHQASGPAVVAALVEVVVQAAAVEAFFRKLLSTKEGMQRMENTNQ